MLRATRPATFLLLLSALWFCGQPTLSETRPAKNQRPDDQPTLTLLKEMFPKAPGEARVALTREGGKIYNVLHVEFSNERFRNNFKVEGAFVFSHYGPFADVFVACLNTGGRLDYNWGVVGKIMRAPGYKHFDFGPIVPAPPPPGERKKRGTREPAEGLVRGGILGLTGKGVIIAVIDSGLDFRHKDFITADAKGEPKSRLLYFWDTTSTAHAEGKRGSKVKAPVCYPDGQAIGTVYTREELTADLRSARPEIPAPDTNSHGTACAGIAAGNGSGLDKKYIGVAPEADLIAVRIGGAQKSLPNAYLLNSICGWLDRVAGARPVVISCSFGGNYGGCDGNLVQERQLNARFPLHKKGTGHLHSRRQRGPEVNSRRGEL